MFKIKQLFRNKFFCFLCNFVIFILISAIIYFKTGKLVHCASVISEDFFMPYWTLSNVANDGILQIFTSSDHSWFILSMVHVLTFRYLPEFLNLHPQICTTNILSFFVFFIVILYCAVFSENLTKFFKNKISFLLGILLVFPIIIYCAQKADFLWAFYNIIWIYAYFLLPMFPLLLMKEFEVYYILGGNNYNKIHIVLFLMLFTAISHEFFRIVFIIALFVGYMFHCFLLKNINHKKFWLKYSIFTAMNMLLFISPQFIELTKYRCEMTSYRNYGYIVNLLFKFLSGIQEFFLLSNICLFIVLFILWTVIFFFVKDKIEKIKFYIYSFSLLLAAFIFIIIMFFVNNYNDMFILTHSGLRFLFSGLLLSLICSSISFVIKYAKSNIIKNIVKFLMILPLFLFLNKDIFNFNETINWVDTYRQDAYILEKVYLLNRGGKYIYMYNRSDNSRPDFVGAEVYLSHLYGPQEVKFESERVKEVCNTSDEWHVCRENMIKKAEELGYVFTEEEIKNHNFSELYKLK